MRFVVVSFGIFVAVLFGANLPFSAIADTPATLSSGQIDQLTAPIALYPDQLLAKICIASTYPLEIVEAERWLQKNGGLKGSALDTALKQQNWDDSVKALVGVPEVLKMMSDRLDWTQKLGDAFLSQQADMMASIQRLRAQAQKNGTLKSTDQQTVSVADQNIVIQPVQPDVVYVPYYDSQSVYGAWAYPDYPPYYWGPPAGYAFAAGVGFLAGAAITAAFWNDGFNWRGGNAYINNNVNFNNFNRYDRNNGQAWSHDPSHRRGVNYPTNDLRQRYGRGTATGADARRNFRGFDTANAGLGGRGSNPGGANRPQAGNRGGFGGTGMFGGNAPAGGGGRGLGQGGPGGGFAGVGNGASVRQFSSRGNSAMGGGFAGGHGGGFRGGRGGGRGRR